MEEQVLQINRCCFGCLGANKEVTLQNYKVQNEALKTMFRTDSICLCYICKRIAQRAEVFIQSVQSNQILLTNFNDIMDSTFQSVRDQTQPLVNLKCFPLYIIQLSQEHNEELEFPISKVYSGIISTSVNIKTEIKEEDGEMSDHIEGEFLSDYAQEDFQDSYVKEEDDFPLKELLKREVKVEFNSGQLQCLKKSFKKKKVKKKIENRCDVGEDRVKKRPDIPKIRHIYITREQCMEERATMLEDKKYLNCLYKCEHCIKGFNFKDSYEKHMEKHSEKFGDYECDICLQRMPSEDKLQSHKRCHQVRYRCSECGLTRVSRLSIKDHYTAIHCLGYYQYNCPHCTKVFRREVSLRKHICYAHTNKERVSCAYCHKTYANKEGLKAHMIVQHPKDEAAGEISKRYVCQECGMGFKAPSLLQKHSVKHSRTRDFYCVECDKSFKSDAVLQHHLKTASPHVNYLELPLPCLHCDKRFAIKRDLERHTNRVHLNIRPYQCDKCEKAYVNGWSLNEHKKLIHEGFKRPMKYPCTMCDKVFDRNQILKSHIRTHTGERPYQCTKCPAQFSQASVLGTHVKLIHLKLTRDGRPKAVAMK